MLGGLGKVMTKMGAGATELEKLSLPELVAMLAKKTGQAGMGAAKFAGENPGQAAMLGGVGAAAGYKMGQPSPEEDAMMRAYKAGY